jgi:MFS family permease
MAAKTAVEGFFGKFTVLRGAVRELWIVFAVKLLTILAYGVMNSTLVLWLSANLGYDDAHAGYLVAGWSMALTLFTVLAGSVVDAIGLRKAFLLGLYVCLLARAVMTFTTVKWLALGCGLLPLALGEALSTPVLVAAVRRYSNTAQRSISFAIFYAMMNVGFLIANFIFDYIRKGLGEPNGHYVLPWVGYELATYRTLFLVSFLVDLSVWPILYFGLREGVEATDEGVQITPRQAQHPNEGLGRALWLTAGDNLRKTGRIFAGLWRQPGFYKFLAFLGLAAFVRLIMYQMHYTYPKFGIRELGAGAPIGRLWAINPLLIIFLVPLVGALTQRVTAYKMVTVGSAIAAASVFIMALPPAWFQLLADGSLGEWIGHGYLRLNGPIHPYYISIFFYIILLSVGEALFSPRLYEYAAAIAPKGQEASYLSLSYLPFFLAKLLVGMASGVLLAKYCPENGVRHSGTLWLIIALTTTVAPVGLLVFRRFIQVHEAGREG